MRVYVVLVEDASFPRQALQADVLVYYASLAFSLFSVILYLRALLSAAGCKAWQRHLLFGIL